MKIDIDDVELDTILAALRFYQQNGMCEPENRSDAIDEIATSNGDEVSLDADSLDNLCERLNCPAKPKTAYVYIVIEGGSVREIVSDDPDAIDAAAQIRIIDYDTDTLDACGAVEQNDGTFVDARVYAEGVTITTIGKVYTHEEYAEYLAEDKHDQGAIMGM